MIQTIPQEELLAARAFLRYKLWYDLQKTKQNPNHKNKLYSCVTACTNSNVDMQTRVLLIEAISILPVRYRKPLMNDLLENMIKYEYIEADEHGGFHFVKRRETELFQMIFMRALISKSVMIDINMAINYICDFSQITWDQFSISTVPTYYLAALFTSLIRLKKEDTLALIWEGLHQSENNNTTSESINFTTVPVYMRTDYLSNDQNMYDFYHYLIVNCAHYHVHEFAAILWNNHVRNHPYLNYETCLRMIEASKGNLEQAIDVIGVMKARELGTMDLRTSRALMWVISTSQQQPQEKFNQWKKHFATTVRTNKKKIDQTFVASVLRSAMYSVSSYVYVLQILEKYDLFKLVQEPQVLRALSIGFMTMEEDDLELFRRTRELFHHTMETMRQGLLQVQDKTVLDNGIQMFQKLGYSKWVKELKR
jgi:hypothetical protein